MSATDTSTEVLAIPDHTDTQAAGRPYPTRGWQQPADTLEARELACELRAWWLDAAQGHLGQHNLQGAAAALAASRHYAPGVAR